MFKDQDAGTITPEEVERTLFELKSEEHKPGTIHRQSARRTGPFVAINWGAIPETLLESELFGHGKGAFTGAAQQRKRRVESAQGGTLILTKSATSRWGCKSSCYGSCKITRYRWYRRQRTTQEHPLPKRQAGASP